MNIAHNTLTNIATTQHKNESKPVNVGKLSDNTLNEKINKQQKQKFANDIYHKDEHIPKNQNTYDRSLNLNF